MLHKGLYQSSYGLENHGIKEAGTVHWNLPSSRLIEIELQSGHSKLAANGALVVLTGKYTGRSPKDKYFVEEPSSKDNLWWGKVNAPIGADVFDALHAEVTNYLQDKDLYVLDTNAGADHDHRLPIRVINEMACQNLFCRQMFITPKPKDQAKHIPEFTVLSAPGYHADAAKYGLNSDTFIMVNLAKKMVLIGGTEYAGEIKKSIFTIMNYLLPLKGVMSMHCSANVGDHNDPAVFFGLSGTGKTTLSADHDRGLIGDDEHGWTDTGIFNYEGGCYAKVIKLNKSFEPEIWDAIRYGCILENIVMDEETREIDYDDGSITQNTRAAYPLRNIEHSVIPSVAGHPHNVIFLTCDAFGVLPPVARLTPDQASYHFISGYTAKVAGTERGMGNEPQATFSTCFGAPFMPLHPNVYAKLLAEKLTKHNAAVWLVNTGWSEGPYGIGHRMRIDHTRAIVNAVLHHDLDSIEYEKMPLFDIDIPKTCPGVPQEILNPRNTWEDKNAYDEKAAQLAKLFIENFENFKEGTSEQIINAGPKLPAMA